MKALHLSGGGTKGIGQFGAVDALLNYRGYKPDLYSGISIGAILIVPIALGKFKQIENVIEELSLKTIFNVPPVNKNGKIRTRSILRFLFGNSFGEQYNIIKELKKVVSESEFNSYCKDPQSPVCIIMSVDILTGQRTFTNVKELTYKEWLVYTLASASIPLFTESVDFRGRILYDGGVRNHIISHWCMEYFPIKESISIYSRPQDFSLNAIDECPSELEKFERSLDIALLQISKYDEMEENNIARTRNIKNFQIFLPRILKGVYDTDKERLEKLKDAGFELGLQYNKPL